MGAICGVIGAMVISYILTRVPSVNGLIDPRLNAIYVVYALGLAVVLGLLGSILPAIRAAQMMPTEALRYE
jgi:putative ABC transport system permease protein